MQWTGLISVVIALAAASVFGLFRRSRQGRIKPMATAPQPAAAPEPVAPANVEVSAEAAVLAGLGVVAGQVTLLQFSSAFCAPCRATRAILAGVAAATDGVAHVEVDAESHLDAVRALGIWRTPTTFIIDTAGRIVGRAQGIPQRDQVHVAVAPLLPNHPHHPNHPGALQGQQS